jgi:hypothetical protein
LLWELRSGKPFALARGMSLCSPKDIYSKTKGRNKAEGRAEKACYNGESSLEINITNKWVLNILDSCIKDINIFDPYIEYKSCFLPVLTEFEEKLINNIATKK